MRGFPLDTGVRNHARILFRARQGRLFKAGRKIAALVCCLLLALPGKAPALRAAGASQPVSQTQIKADIDGLLNWKKAQSGVPANGNLMDGAGFLDNAGTPAGDWFAIALGRDGVRDGAAGFLAALAGSVTQRYRTADKLSAVKATEWSRIALAVEATGGDPTAVGSTPDGKSVNLIADGAYNYERLGRSGGSTRSLGAQGVNGWIWALIELDSKRYTVPAGAADSRADLITAILREQLGDGGFALSGSAADADSTAMAVQALAPYYYSVETYRVQSAGKTVTETVRQAADRALARLSRLQGPDGGFQSWGTESAESAAQAVIALCSLGIDPQTDARFVKNGQSALGALLRCRRADGGFAHTPAGQSDEVAGEQALCALVAVDRGQQGLRAFYDFRPEMPAALRQKIRALDAQIVALGASPRAETVRDLFAVDQSIPASEQCYVYHYADLAAAMKRAGIADNSAAARQSAMAAGSRSGSGVSAASSDSGPKRAAGTAASSSAASGPAAAARLPRGEATQPQAKTRRRAFALGVVLAVAAALLLAGVAAGLLQRRRRRLSKIPGGAGEPNKRVHRFIRLRRLVHKKP